MGSLAVRKPISLSEKLKIIDKLVDDINTKEKKKVIGRIGRKKDIEDGILEKLRLKFIPTPSENFNAATGGGIPRGRTSIIVGLPDSGKTSIALETIGYNMRLDPNFTACWLESEDSLVENYITGPMTIDPERFVLLEQRRDSAGETALDRLEAAIASGAFDFICINSLKALVPSEEYQKSLKDGVVGVQARMNSRMMRKYTAPISEFETAFVIITHLSADIGKMFGDPLVISGGKAIIYGSSLIVDLRKRSLTETDPVTKEEGMKIGVTVRRNHCVPHRNPYVKTDYYVIFGEGIEQHLTTLQQALDQGILKKAGAYIKDLDKDGELRQLPDGTRLQWNGKRHFREFCQDHPEYFTDLKLRVKGEITSLTSEEIEEIQAEEKLLEESVKQEE